MRTNSLLQENYYSVKKNFWSTFLHPHPNFRGILVPLILLKFGIYKFIEERLFSSKNYRFFKTSLKCCMNLRRYNLRNFPKRCNKIVSFLALPGRRVWWGRRHPTHGGHGPPFCPPKSPSPDPAGKDPYSSMGCVCSWLEKEKTISYERQEKLPWNWMLLLGVVLIQAIAIQILPLFTDAIRLIVMCTFIYIYIDLII